MSETSDTELYVCGQHNCTNPADWKFTWPGKDEAGICNKCKPNLVNIVDAMGMYLQLRPIVRKK